ncbi:hypothetical protein DFH06DRAFT_1143459 [Mycena polygramma]|nr:hypothetical protein DFH06DRAFT_1143459 [Mycena polygramma]
MASSYRYKGTKKKRTAAQKQHTAGLGTSAAIDAPSDADKENDTEEALCKAKRRGDEYQKDVYSERKRLKCSHIAAAKQSALLTEVQLENERLRAEADTLTAEPAKKAMNKAQDEISKMFSFSLKENGVVPDSTWDMINDLVALDGVRLNKVVGVLKRIAGKLGIDVTGDASDRTVRRVVKEGGVGAKMQFVEAVGSSQGVTLSSDGTTHKNINLESHRATVINQDGEKQTFFLGIGMAINHTSETQLEGWEELIEAAYLIYKTSARCQTADDAQDFWLKVTGWHSDHTEDQKKLFRLVEAMKLRLERECRGERAIAQMVPAQWADLLFRVSQDAVTATGGISALEGLGEAERQALHSRNEFDKLSPEEQQDIDLFIWGGCCMHKNLNIFKGAVLAMQQWWVESGLPGPLAMYNHDNAAAVTLGEGTGAATRAEEHTVGGAIKVVALAVVVVNMELLLQFLVYVRENKGSRTLNHMELNVERGFGCWFTWHEFVVIPLLNQNIEVPYMLEIRGPLHAHDNLLKLGPLHKKVKEHLTRIMANPKLITGVDCACETASLNGRMWEKSEVVYVALNRISEWKLEHVDALVVAYCKGALATWSRFDTEWSEDGSISKLSPQNIERAWLEVTNDGNESELGMTRLSAQSAPNMSLAYHSALRMYKVNKTSEYVPTLSAADRQTIRKQARLDDASGATRQAKHAQIVHMKEVVDKNTKHDGERKECVEKAKEILANTTAITSVQELDDAFQIGCGGTGYLAVTALDLQLDSQGVARVSGNLGIRDRCERTWQPVKWGA